MRYQRTKSSCGPAALSNALEALGIKRSEEELAALCKQTPEGTTAKNLCAALATIDGVRGTVISEARADVAVLRLLQALYEGRPVICCVSSSVEWDHWATAQGILGFGKRIVCVDSGDNDMVKMRSVDEFVEWWEGPEGAAKPFWGVIL